MTIFCYDTEFLDDGKTIELISIGIVDEHGHSYYAVNDDCDFERVCLNDWLWGNVVPHLPITRDDFGDFPIDRPGTELDRKIASVKPKWVIANEIRDFIRENDGEAQLWAYYAAYDHVALAQLFGPMKELPTGVPMWTHDIMQLIEGLDGFKLPKSPANEHNALADAQWGMNVIKLARQSYDKLKSLR